MGKYSIVPRTRIGKPPYFVNTENIIYAYYDGEDEFESAIDAYQEAIELDAEFQDAYYNLASAYHSRDLFQDAIQYYQKAIELDENDADAHSNLGEVYQETGQFELAIKAYQKALSIDSSDPLIYYRLAQAYQKKGDRLTMQRYLDRFLESAANLPQFQDEIENAEQMKRGEDTNSD